MNISVTFGTELEKFGTELGRNEAIDVVVKVAGNGTTGTGELSSIKNLAKVQALNALPHLLRRQLAGRRSVLRKRHNGPPLWA